LAPVATNVTAQTGLQIPAKMRPALPVASPAPSAARAAPTKSYNTERADYAQATSRVATAAPHVQRNKAETAGFMTGAFLSAPSDLVGRAARSIASLGEAAFDWNIATVRAGGAKGFVAALLLPLTGLARALGLFLRGAAWLIDLPFAGIRWLCDIPGRRGTRERRVNNTSGNFARVLPKDWPDLETNRATIARIAAYKAGKDHAPYDVILVPGETSDHENEPLSKEAASRLDQATADYKAGKAPFILVSGGNVHPKGTAYNEAFEMRRYLIDHCGVPADAILVEPSAEHTTHNLRNGGRLMEHLGLSRALITTTPTPVIGQSAYLGDPGGLFYGFDMRSLVEDGTRFGKLTRVDAAHIAFIPADTVNLVHLRGGAPDPTDP